MTVPDTSPVPESSSDTSAGTSTVPPRSREYTITMHPGAQDVIAQMAARVARSFMEAQRDAESYEDAVTRLRDAGEQAVNLLGQLSRVIYPSHGDGNVHLYPDPAPESIGFRWDSGYTGACILHGAQHGPRNARWSTHT